MSSLIGASGDCIRVPCWTSDIRRLAASLVDVVSGFLAMKTLTKNQYYVNHFDGSEFVRFGHNMFLLIERMPFDALLFIMAGERV